MAGNEFWDHEDDKKAMSEAEDQDEEIIEKIVDRVIQQSVPVVEPHEQSVVPLPEATELAAWARTIDRDVLNAYVDKEFGEYRPTVVDDTGRTEWHIKATWAQSTLYLHLRTFKAEHAGQIVASEVQEETTPQNVVLTALSALLPETPLRRRSRQTATLHSANTAHAAQPDPGLHRQPVGRELAPFLRRDRTTE